MSKVIAVSIAATACAALIVTQMAFATAFESSESAEAIQPNGQSFCKDFNFWFLHRACSQMRSSRAARAKHHGVATFITGHLVTALTPRDDK